MESRVITEQRASWIYKVVVIAGLKAVGGRAAERDGATWVKDKDING